MWHALILTVKIFVIEVIDTVYIIYTAVSFITSLFTVAIEQMAIKVNYAFTVSYHLKQRLSEVAPVLDDR